MPSPKSPERRALNMLLLIVLGVAFVGFFVGVRPRPQADMVFSEHDSSPVDPNARPARTNLELATRPWSTELPTWHASKGTVPKLTARQQSAARAEAISNRDVYRSYEGAPPTIPHPVGQGSAVECRACHENGARIGQTLAPPMSHVTYTMCTQCHVPAKSPIPSNDASSHPVFATNFVGLRGMQGPYVWALGPPQIPHPTKMRERCSSCHGDLGRVGLQTPHADRRSCTQCHAPSSVLDQRN